MRGAGGGQTCSNAMRERQMEVQKYKSAKTKRQWDAIMMSEKLDLGWQGNTESGWSPVCIQ